jgi:hypothetical protein
MTSAEKKSWEEHVREARTIERGREGETLTAADMMRAELARRLEGAHEKAVREAEQLAEDATRLATRLKQDGLGAVFSGNGFLGQAQAAREALLRLESAREVFTTALRMQKAHNEVVARGG